MNLGIVRARLVEIFSSTTKQHDIKKLIEDIDKEVEAQREQSDLSAVSSVIDDYSSTLTTLEMEFLAITGTSMQDVSRKVHNLNEQLCILSLINTYLSNFRLEASDFKISKYCKIINDKKENFKGLAIQKTACLKSLYTEQEYNTKLIEYKIAQADFSAMEEKSTEDE